MCPTSCKPAARQAAMKRSILVPAVEADAEGFVFQDAVHFREGRLEPAVVVVVGNAAAGAVAVVHEIGRIGQDEIDALGGESAHEADAIAEHDGVDGVEAEAGHCDFLFV